MNSIQISPLKFFSSRLPALSEAGRKFLSQAIQEVSFSKGEMIFRENETVSGVYFLLSGRVGIQKETGFEEKTQVIALLAPGAPLAERGVLPQMVHGAGALAVEETVLGLLTYADYDVFCKKEPNDGRILLEWLLLQASRRLEKASERLVHVL